MVIVAEGKNAPKMKRQNSIVTPTNAQAAEASCDLKLQLCVAVQVQDKSAADRYPEQSADYCYPWS